MTQDFRRESSVMKMIHEQNWDSLAERWAKSKVTILYRIANQLVAIPIDMYLHPAATNIRGHNDRFFVPYSRTKIMQYSFFPDTARLWNQLPSDSTTAPSLEAFRGSLQGRSLL